MTDAPSTDNKTADFFNGLISALMSGGEAAAITYVTSIAPEVFAFPVMSWLLTQAIDYVGQFLSIAGQKFTDQIVIDIQTHGEQSSVITTSTALQFALASGNATDIALATANASQAWRGLINWDGSAQPQ